jgi:hypothetical protein
MPSCSILNRGCGGQLERGWRRLWCTSEDGCCGELELEEEKSRGMSDPDLGISVGVWDAGLAICDGGSGDVAPPSSSSSTTSVVVEVL